MDDFLYVLKLELEGKIPEDQMFHQLDLYRKYMDAEMEKGKTLEQVLRKLGDPSKISQLIVESYEKREKEAKKPGSIFQDQETADRLNSQIQNPEHGLHAEFIPDQGWDVRIGKLKLNTWYGTLLILGVVLLIFGLLSRIFPGLQLH